MPSDREERIADFVKPFRVEPGSKVSLEKDFDPTFKTGVSSKKEGRKLLARGIESLAEYQSRLYAQDTHGVLIVLQALDAAGKDGTIRHVMSGVNPQGVSVHSFKFPRVRNLIMTTSGGMHNGCPAAARSESSIGPITRRYSSFACIRNCWTVRSFRRTAAGQDCGSVASGRSMTGSARSPTTESRS